MATAQAWNIANDSGDTVVFGGAAGTVTVAANMQNLQAGIIQFDCGATLDLNGNNLSTGQLTGYYTSAIVTNSSSTFSTLTIGGASGSETYSGKIIGNLGVTVSPPSSGDFALYLYGTANTYSGSTVIGNGSNLAYLVPAGENSLSANSAVTVDAGSVLALDAPTSPSPTTTIPSLDGGGEVVNNGASPVETLTIAGSAAGNFTGQVLGTSGQDVALVMSGGTQTLGGADTYGGGTTISGGTLTVSAANNLGSGPLTLNGGTLDATASFTSDATTTLGANGGTIEVGTAANTLTLTSEVSGGGGFVKTGSGTLNLNCHNFYNGTTDIQTGTVAVGADGDYYSLGNIGTVDIEQNGTLDLNGQSVNIGPLMGSGIVTSSTGGGTSYLTLYTTGATTFSGTITNGSGQVEVVMAGSGTQTLSGTNNSYTSATVADTGQLVLAAGCVLGNTPIWVYGGATLLARADQRLERHGRRGIVSVRVGGRHADPAKELDPQHGPHRREFRSRPGEQLYKPGAEHHHLDTELRAFLRGLRPNDCDQGGGGGWHEYYRHRPAESADPRIGHPTHNHGLRRDRRHRHVRVGCQ